ncbi:unnamed protein product [Sphenostylis stenocarpa]|uniref:Uncharacterized protein n=1 Tax=Sphenostylis stenocarpa TaxID=92480 RepID=A0AA86VFW1_9FABA|nr:unnamed protein product [Sphenostylis stenocarpa]
MYVATFSLYGDWLARYVVEALKVRFNENLFNESKINAYRRFIYDANRKKDGSIKLEAISAAKMEV